MKLLSRLRGVFTAGLLLCLAACGPGVGGTGTGSVPDPGHTGLRYFGATAQNVCLAPFAEVLGCAVGTGTGGDPAEPSLSGERHFAADCAVASFQADVVNLDVLCAGWFFSGRWGLGPDGVGRYHGLVGPDPVVPPSEPATLEVQAQGPNLVVWLRAADGQLLVGPLSLVPVLSGR